jgi:hypothetical protein
MLEKTSLTVDNAAITELLLVRVGKEVISGVNNVSAAGTFSERMTPNPVTAGSSAHVEYTLPEADNVAIEVHDVQGVRLMRMSEGRRSAGSHTVNIPTDRLESGTYYYSIITDRTRVVRPFVVVE